jgi:RimJ/RimL family protein N-acetyltransferase
VFRSNGTTIISVPESDVTSATSRAANLSIASMTPDAILRDLFRDRISKFIGPAYQGFISQKSFRAVTEPEARLATTADIDALKKLASDCSQEDWEHSSIDFDDERIFIATVGQVIVAAASVKRQAGIYPSLGFVTHLEHRGKGFGAAVASAAVADALGSNTLVLWQTLVANVSSIKVAERLGVEKFAESNAARLSQEG